MFVRVWHIQGCLVCMINGKMLQHWQDIGIKALGAMELCPVQRLGQSFSSPSDLECHTWDIFDLKPSFDDEGIKLQVHWNALEMLHFPSALWPRFLGDICVTVHLCEELWGCVGNTACWLSEGWWEGRRVVCMGRICVGGSVFLR